jgi:hypothetical protein
MAHVRPSSSRPISRHFTDIVLDVAGKRLSGKVLTYPEAAEQGVLDGIGRRAETQAALSAPLSGCS